MHVSFSKIFNSPVGLGCRIRRLRLWRDAKTCSANECPRYDTKQSDGEALVLELYGLSSTPLLPLLPGPFWSRMVVPDRVLSMGQIEMLDSDSVQTNDLYWIVRNRTLWEFSCVSKRRLIELLLIHTNIWNHLTVCKRVSNIE